MTEKQVKDYEKFVVRFPDGMRDMIADRAKRNGRSMNSEIVAIVSNAISEPALAQEGIDFILDLAESGKYEQLSIEQKAKIHGILTDAASILAKNIETETSNLRKLLFLLSQGNPQ